MEKEHMEILLEDINSKFQLVLEAHGPLHTEMQTVRRELSEQIAQVDYKVDVVNERVNALDKKVDVLDRKVDAVAADLTAHRADTEAHHGVYRVKEPGV
ncbi:hypothetical protein [Geomonas sp.]|uniref:hypothetical protein n=1 Tax=Geomonas sp. TaxID=2651584 RepID=UPI002B4A5B3B|nr:hypothetical protein [Geomonas sp.]HJV36015.1 hypothetical protein [Geomonas sp.]